MNLSAVNHESTLLFRQPIARNRIHFRLITATADCEAVTLHLWKRSEPYPESVLALPMKVRYSDGLRDEWETVLPWPEETHYLKYYFTLRFSTGEVKTFNEHGFGELPAQRGAFEILQANETDVPKSPAWCRGAIYYQIFPERFAAGNPGKTVRDYVPWNSEPTRENFFGGDLAGIRQKLPYLAELGVECLYLTPVFAGDFNHKYATTDYFRIDPDFGTAQDLCALVDEAHRKGIRVILDGVFNHVGVHFAPFADVLAKGEDSAYRDWFYLKRQPVTIDAACYECVGDYPFMPRLRTANPDVRAFVENVMLHWLKTAKIDGWRLDVADELDAASVRYWRERVRAEYPDAVLLGETWGDATRMVAEGDQFDCAMNYLFRDTMVDFFAADRIDAAQLDNRLQHMLMKYPEAVNHRMYNCLGSHDTPRFATEAGGESWRVKLAMAFQLLFPGSPAIYYGDELGMLGENDPGCRGGMAWETGDEALLAWTRELIMLRKAHPAVREGSYRTLVAKPQSNGFVFERYLHGDRVTAAFNRGSEPITLDLADAGGTVLVPPRSVKIIT